MSTKREQIIAGEEQANLPVQGTSQVDAVSAAPTPSAALVPVQKPTPKEVAPRFAGLTSISLLTAYLILLSILLLYSLVELWPLPTPAGTTAPITSPASFLFWTFSISDEVRLLLIVALAGALGGLVHALRSLYWYIGNRDLVLSWLAMYILLPFVGTSLGLVFYFVIRGGFFSPQATVQQTSPFGFAALAGLIGMFSQQAVLKLKQVAETLLAKPPEGKDSKPEEPKPGGSTIPEKEE